VQALVEVAVHPAHLAVEHVAGAVPLGMAISDGPSAPLTAEIQDVLQDDPREVSGGPLPERTQPLCEAPTVGGVAGFPDPLGDIRGAETGTQLESITKPTFRAETGTQLESITREIP